MSIAATTPVSEYTSLPDGCVHLEFAHGEARLFGPSFRAARVAVVPGSVGWVAAAAMPLVTITAWEALGITLRERAKRHGLEHLFTGLPRTTLTDEDPVVIASDESETQTLSERDAERLRRE